jgi:hypothetical protein
MRVAPTLGFLELKLYCLQSLSKFLGKCISYKLVLPLDKVKGTLNSVISPEDTNAALTSNFGVLPS